jgi:ABC-type uncharacterized transport system permease subunit
VGSGEGVDWTWVAGFSFNGGWGARRLRVVEGMLDRILYMLALAFYAAATVAAFRMWKRGFTRDEWWCYGFLACGVLPNAGALMARGFSLQKCPVTNLFEAVMFITWAVVLIHLVIGIVPKLRFLCALASPTLLALGMFGMQPGLDQPARELDLTHRVVSLHAALVLLAYGMFGLSAMAAGLYLVQERNLKFAKVRAVLSRLPSIERLDKVVTSSLAVGLGLLSVGLAMSVILVRDAGGAKVMRGDPKVLWSILVWTGYVVLLVARLRRGWGPRTLAWGAVGTFAFVMLTFWGTNLLSPSHH